MSLYYSLSLRKEDENHCEEDTMITDKDRFKRRETMQNLVEIADDQNGRLTYRQVAGMIPPEVTNPNELDAYLLLLAELDIKIVDELIEPLGKQKGHRS